MEAALADRIILADLIETYRAHPCLWDRASPLAKNPTQRKKAWTELAKILKNLDPDANIESAKKKIENMRSAYHREQKRLLESIRTASSPDDVHQPQLWYFEMMQFLDKNDPIREEASAKRRRKRDRQSKKYTTAETVSSGDDDEPLKKNAPILLRNLLCDEPPLCDDSSSSTTTVTTSVATETNTPIEGTTRVPRFKSTGTPTQIVVPTPAVVVSTAAVNHTPRTTGPIHTNTRPNLILRHNKQTTQIIVPTLTLRPTNPTNQAATTHKLTNVQPTNQKQTNVQPTNQHPTNVQPTNLQSTNATENVDSSAQTTETTTQPKYVPVRSRKRPSPRVKPGQAPLENPQPSIAYALYVSEKLEELGADQRVIAEKLISDVIFLARMNRLGFDAKVEAGHLRPTQNSQPHLFMQIEPLGRVTASRDDNEQNTINTKAPEDSDNPSDNNICGNDANIGMNLGNVRSTSLFPATAVQHHTVIRSPSHTQMSSDTHILPTTVADTPMCFNSTVVADPISSSQIMGMNIKSEVMIKQEELEIYEEELQAAEEEAEDE